MSASICTILGFSDEILMQIIRHLNARERTWLGNTCMKFYGLVFREKRFVRNLDFSEDAYLVSSSEVQQYFKDVTMCEHIRTINLGNMCCLSPEPMLRDMKKATNLVELNIIGITFDDFSHFGSLLNPLGNLKKLSARWPKSPDPTKGATMEKTFNRLEHLTIRVDDSESIVTFLSVLSRFAQKLQKLYLLLVHIGVWSSDVINLYEALHGLELTPLPELKIAAGYSIHHRYFPFDEVFTEILPDYERWTQFHLDWHGLLYYEKDLKVTQEMCSRIHIEDRHADDQNARPIKYVEPGQLLADAAQITTGAEAKNFDCLRQGKGSIHPVMLKIEDMKLLLENPRHQVSYIHMEHDLEPTCFTYLSAFPDLKQLVLYGVIKASSIPYYPAEVEDKLKDSNESRETANPNPVFQKLVESTPHLKDFVLSPTSKDEEDPWDLTALHLISKWQVLTTLFLANIPIVNGKFLVEIGKQCKNLEKLRLEDIGPSSNFCYKKELSKMLTHCHNLKDFSMVQENIGQVSDMFTMFAQNSRLQRLRIKSFGRQNTVDKLVPRIKTLIRSHELILLWCEFDALGKDALDNLRSKVQRLDDQLNRPAFEFKFIGGQDSDNIYRRRIRNYSLEYAHHDLLLPHELTNALHQLGC